MTKAKKEKAPGLVKGAIDFAGSRAREILKTMFPKPETEKVRKATPAHEALVQRYLAARAAEKTAREEKEAAGNALCHAIGKDLGIRGNGWEATWSLSSGTVDWKRLAEDEHIPADRVEQYRRDGSRSLDVVLAKKD